MKRGFLHVGVASTDETTIFCKRPSFAAAAQLCQKCPKYANYFLPEPDRANKCIISFFFFFLNPGLEMTDSSRVFDRLEFNPVLDHRSASYSVSSQHQKLLDRRWACGRKWTERKEVRLDEPQRSGGTERQLGHEWVANEERLERRLLGRWICRITLSQWR